MIKKIILFGFLFVLPVAHAKVIELDNHNAAHCQQQLQNDIWDQNVVLLYVNDAPYTKSFRNSYEEVAAKYPDKNFYFALSVFNPKANAEENALIWKTVNACLTDMMSGSAKSLGEINAKTPAMLFEGYSAARIGVGKNQISTKEDIIRFLGKKTR